MKCEMSTVDVVHRADKLSSMDYRLSTINKRIVKND